MSLKQSVNILISHTICSIIKTLHFDPSTAKYDLRKITPANISPSRKLPSANAISSKKIVLNHHVTFTKPSPLLILDKQF